MSWLRAEGIADLADEHIPFEICLPELTLFLSFLRQNVFTPEREKRVVRRLINELAMKNIVDRTWNCQIVGEAMARTVGVTHVPPIR